MPSTRTVTTRPSAISFAWMAPPMSICDISQPPKISPLALVSAGIASVRSTSSPLGKGRCCVIAVCF